MNANSAVAQARRAWALGIVILILAAGGARAESWPATPAGRLAARAELDRFEAGLNGLDSATEALRRWCAGHRMADPPMIRAIRIAGADKAADAATRRALHAGPDEPIFYRRVRLTCGDRVLSEADNWYRPGVLTPEMNRDLEATDTPFGLVVRPLGFHRRPLGVQWLYDPLSRRTRSSAGELVLPPEVLRHRAVLETGKGEPFSLVVETYTGAILAARPVADTAVSP